MSLPCGLGVLLAQQTGQFWMPPRASTTAGAVDWLFNLILVISAFFFSLIIVLMLVFVIRYRRRPGMEQKKAASHSTPLEVTWTLIPVGIVVYLFYAGFTTFMDMKTPPRNSYEVRVVARQWSWLFQYPNGVETNELHVPVDRPVLLTMSSLDVIHSLYIPAFRVKMDIVPGRYTQTWFQAVKPGDYDLYCSAYCGTNHSGMITHVVVHPPGEFESWLDETERKSNNLPPAQRGARLFVRKGCASCHTVDGTPKIGPTLKGVYGSMVRIAGGPPVKADDDYIRESILDPDAKIVEGFESVRMSTFKGQLKEHEINELIEYIKTLKK
jgi:cytochrome c oxidase subunit 2